VRPTERGLVTVICPDIIAVTKYDVAKGHREGETCRFCVSMNVIRRAFGDIDEQVPLLTWFAQYVEQRQIRGEYKKLYEQEHAKLDKVRRDVQERILELQAKQERVRSIFPDKATGYGNAVAELSVIKYALKE
jgi:hypothetical protein